jgi:hypothetical protein
VELLSDHALRQRTPAVALHGGLRDGKSSVLNLLKQAVEGQAIVVSFNAWLPGSEATAFEKHMISEDPLFENPNNATKITA